MTEYNKPLPKPDQDTVPFWEACKKHELLIQQCKSCRSYIFYPRIFCPVCLGEPEWVKAKGTGEVYSYSVYYQIYHPVFADDIPYVVALVLLDEGVMMTSRIVGCKPDEVYPGMRVEVDFLDATPEVTLYQFKPVSK